MMNTESLVKEFADGVAAQSTCIEQGDSDMGNMYAKRYVAAFEKLRARGDEGRDALATLLEDSQKDVRMMAAAFLLRHCHEKAMGVLKKESQSTGLVAFGARQTLKRWEEGLWMLDPE